MKRRPFRNSYLARYKLGNNQAVTTAETVLASAQVIGLRAGRMALAGATPNARDQREFALMGKEKIDAGAQ